MRSYGISSRELLNKKLIRAKIARLEILELARLSTDEEITLVFANKDTQSYPVSSAALERFAPRLYTS